MAGELHIVDEGLEQEFLSCPTPIAFIDFETFMPETPGIIPGTMVTDLIPCQWSCHTMYEHGLNWEGNLRHGEFLWTGDVGWSPIYAFVQSLYEETRDAASIWIYTSHEIRSLDACQQLAQNDMDAMARGEISPDYKVVDMYGNKIPLMEIAPNIYGWCESIKARLYDQCYGPISKGRQGGVLYWLHSPEFHRSNSIKYIMPAAMKEYSRSAELLASEGEPPNGYEGLRAMGCIAKGDECQSYYLQALNREPLPLDAPGAAPFDAEIEHQCLIYCQLDTLSMVLIYLAVLEATENWRRGAGMSYAGFAYFPEDGHMHSIDVDGDNQVFYKTCDTGHNFPYGFDYELQLMTEEEFQNMPIRDQYELMCPHCRRLRNMA